MLIARGYITIWACKDGESISLQGKWQPGVVTPYLGVVRMGRYSFACKVRSGSINPPMWIYTDAIGDRFTYDDGGYVLTEEINTAEYEIIAEDGVAGMQGVPGKPGSDGKTYYTWIRYADDASGKGISNDPKGKSYIGFAYNKEHVVESNNPADYTWTLIKGDKGDTGLQGLQGPQGLQGIPGEPGTAGKTTYFHVKYSPVQNPTVSQMTETPNVFIGTYVDFTEADSTDPKKYVWTRHQGLQGPKGDQGIPGKNGANGQTSYLHIAYATSADGSQGFDTANPAGKSYIGVCVDFNQADPTSYKNYTWSLIKGLDGVPGKPGIDGKTYYTWIAYSDNPNGSPMYQVPHAKTKYIGIAVNKTSATESTNPADYTWSKFQGDKGDTGQQGPQGNTGPTGPQGDSCVCLGRWRAGMTVPKLGVVRMGIYSFMAKVATTHPPLCVYTDHHGVPYAYHDGGYVLTGETNTAEYEIIAEDGQPGTQGLDGCVIRDSEWNSAGVLYRNDEELTSGTRFLDIALVETTSNNVGYDCYKCKITHISSTGNQPGTPGGNAYWEFMSNVGPIFTSLLIAKNAKIKFLQGNQLLIQKANGSVTAGLSGSDAGEKTRFWAGSNMPDSAPFAVDETGTVTAERFRTGRSGCRMEAYNGVIDIFGSFARNIQFGVNEKGMAVLKYFDNNGNLLYDLGPGGITKVQIREESWRKDKWTFLAVELDTVFDDFGVWRKACTPEPHTGQEVHQFYCKIVAGVKDDPVNDGKYFNTQIIGTDNIVADGWYANTFEPKKPQFDYPRLEWGGAMQGSGAVPQNMHPKNPPVSGYERIYFGSVFKLSGGVIVNRQEIYYNLGGPR